MSRPSDPLIARLRQIASSRSQSEAELALGAGLALPRLRQVLSGEQAMTVDELIQLSQALALEPEDLGMDLGTDEDPTPYEAPTSLPYDDPDADIGPHRVGLPDHGISLSDMVDPLGNQIRQLFEVGFGLGCTFFFQAATAELKDSGVPRMVLERYGDGELPIQLDAAYHSYNEPEFDGHGVTLKLSFDAIYTCTFPWTSIRRMAFFPDTPEPEPEEPVEEEEPPKPGGAPFLRLVE